MSKSNYYKAAINILAGNEISDWRSVCLKIAEHNPAAFVRAVRGEDSVARRYRELAASEGKISAIKAYRLDFRVGLKEAKDKIASFCEG